MAETSKVKQYFVKCFDKKLLIKKAIIAFIALLIVLALSLSFYFWLKDKPEEQPYGQVNKFWYLYIVWNTGMGWSAMSRNLPAIYSLQSIVFILLLSIFLLLTHDKITCSFVALAMFGGLFNLIQRACATGAHVGCVLDYFRFGFWPSFPVFNWPDMFVVTGILGFIISYITLTIIQIKKENKNAKH